MGAIKEHAEEIDGKLYRCKTFTASEGLVLFPRLVALLGEEMVNLVLATGDRQLADLLGDRKVVAAMMVKISERAAEDDGLLVLREVLKHTVYVRRHQEPGAKAPVEVPESVYKTFDEHFAGDYMHLLNVCIWVGRASFGAP